MQFSTARLLLTATLLSTAVADGIFAINATGTIGSTTTVHLQVLNGDVWDAPKCSGIAHTGPLPASGNIPCDPGYGLSYSWAFKDGAIAATYTAPSNTFTYNVPNTGCSGHTCTFGFQNLYPSKRARRSYGA